MRTLSLALGLLILVSCNDDSRVRTDNSSTVGPVNSVTEADYLRTRDRTIQYLKNHMYSGKKYNGDDAAFLKLENDSIQLLENRLRQILSTSRITNLTQEGKLNLEALSEGLGFGMLDGLNVKNGSRTTFCTSRSLFTKYFGRDTVNKLESIEPATLEAMFQSALYSDVHVTNFSTIKLNSPNGSIAYGMVASIAQDIGAFTPHVLLVLLADSNFVYIVEETIPEGFKEIQKCKLVWDSLNTLSDEEFKRYKESNLHDTTAFDRRVNLEQKAWDEYCTCYRTQLPKDDQFKDIRRQMDKILEDLR